MRLASYTDERGRTWTTQLTDGMPDSDASMGLPVGPPSIDPLGLPEDTATLLHNQLCARGIFTYEQAKARRQEIFAALQSAFRIDTDRVVELYNRGSSVIEEVPKSANGRKRK